MIYLDTHVIVWLYAGETDRLSDKARNKIETEELSFSPLVLLELDFLYEIKRINTEGQKIINTLQASIDLQRCKLDFYKTVQAASREIWTRDPFDRIIVSQAKAMGNKELVTKDENILSAYKKAIW